VHFPTDINLLWDASRKCLALAKQLEASAGMVCGFRKNANWKKHIKRAFRNLNRVRHGGGKDKRERVKNAAVIYLNLCAGLSEKIKKNQSKLDELGKHSNHNTSRLQQLKFFERMLDKHIDLVRRRIINGETIPPEEKMFSLFEIYTRWINKGKSHNRVELGLPVTIASDQFGFILHHKVMETESDVHVAEPVAHALMKYGALYSLSFDKGFWNPDTYAKLKDLVDILVMPKKGKPNKKEKARESSKEFKRLRHEHSAVESDINALEHHGLNKCPDRGLKHFKRYVALGVLSLNLHRLGNVLFAQERKKKTRKRKRAA